MRRIISVSALGAMAMGLAVCATSLATPPLGNETINYSYDARGRLINVTHTGSVNNNIVSNYTYDKADNRTNVKVTGAP